MEDNTVNSILAEQTISCPLCNSSFYKEIINHKSIKQLEIKENIELRQLYKQDPDIGTIIPPIYSIVVCPSCYYASFEQDLNPNDNNIKQILINNELNRKKLISSLFTEEMSFKKRRTIEHGFLSYLLAIESYKLRENYKKIYTFKKALCSLRASWLAKDILNHYKESSFSIIYSILFRKATKYYASAFSTLQNENLNNQNFIGPDTNNNWGYNGFLYITGYLNYKLTEYSKDKNKKTKTLNNVMKIMSKILQNNNDNNTLTNNAKEIYNLAKISIKKG